MRQFRMAIVLAICGVTLLSSMQNAAADEPKPEPAPLFPFVLPWNDSSKSVTNISEWIEAPAGRHGPLAVKDGHLYAGPSRFRIFGVNLCFAANFPTHEAARQVAARMRKFGINCVRFHHMDMLRSPDGIFAADGRTLDAKQLDRLDFLIAELKRNGIYADLNLHVSRTYPDLATWEGMPGFFKGVDNFDPKMIEWQRSYARALLTHLNPYTKTRYVDEPAVALIEINNENALLFQWWTGELDGMPAIYGDELKRLWNEWLSKKHSDFAELKRRWGASESALGHELLANTDFAKNAEGWILEQHQGAKAVVGTTPERDQKSSLHIEIQEAGREGWHVQLAQSKLVFDHDQPYTLHFRARADAPRRISVAASQAHDPWQALWSSDIALTPEWREFQFAFSPSATDDNARIVFGNLASAKGSVWLSDVSLRPGGVLGLRPGESNGQIEIFPKRDFGSRTPEAQRDWVRFLWEREEQYWIGMAKFVKDDLHAHALIVGTQMGWSPYPIQARFDVIDSHAYWQHPNFPDRQWDMSNWVVKNVPMAGALDGGTLPQLGLSRVAGKPFICTEYNHSAPNTYAAESFPLIAAYAALQDWDGIFAFAYSHRGEWDVGRIPGFFDIDQHPTKMATLPASVALFVRGDVASPGAAQIARPALADLIDRVRRSGPYLGADMFGVDRGQALRGPVAIAQPGAGPRSETSSPESKAASSATAFAWNPGGESGVVTVDALRSKAIVGRFPPGKTTKLGDVTVTAGPTRQEWATLLVTALDGQDFKSPGRVLITAAGYAENTAMGWKNAERSTVGPDWGRSPSLVEGIAAEISLPLPAARVSVWALDERGQRKSTVHVKDREGRATITIGPEHKTLWYEVELSR